MPTIKHPEYELIVAKSSNGDYLVNFYCKMPDKLVNGLEGVIGFMSQLEKRVIEKEPILRGLSEEDERIIRAVRELMLSRVDR